MEDLIRKQLEQEIMTPFHKALRDHVKSLVDMSRDHMSKYYDAWDRANDTYRGIRTPDKADAKAEERGEPTKMVVPLTYAQVQTFTAFCMALYTQRERMFELVGRGEEDHRAAKVGEALLARDLTYNLFEAKLYQFLIDLARYGLGIFKTGWIVKRKKKMVKVETPPLVSGMTELAGPQTLEVEQEVVTYEGNEVTVVSPYHFFPDVRLPLNRFQQGEFCASEDVYSMTHLRQLEAEGAIAGVKYVKPLDLRDSDSRRIGEFAAVTDGSALARPVKSPGMAILTEVQVSLIPAQFLIDGKPMGPETAPVRYNVWLVNDDRVVKAEPLNYPHGLYCYDIAEFAPDQQRLINEGLAQSIDQLQAVITWLINSHITSVRKTIQNWLVVDPAGIEMKDLVNRSPVIRLRTEVARTGVEKWVKQLDVRDVTASHIPDAMALHQLVQIVTGINDNALGQFHQGRRSATEAKNVNSATAARLKVVALLIFRCGLESMARKMLANLQDGLTEETYVKVIGEFANPLDYMQFTKVTRDDLVGEYDFEIFDGTLPSERALQAQSIQEFLTALMSNPETVMLLGYDPRKLVEEWLELRGVRNPKRFLVDQMRAQELQIQMQMAGLTPTPQGPTNGQLPGAGNGAGSTPPAFEQRPRA